MTTQELRELDAWIAECVMGKKVFHAASAKGYDWWWSPHDLCVMKPVNSDPGSFKPTERSGDAMDVLKKCAENNRSVSVCNWNGEWLVAAGIFVVKGETLEIAICETAKQLFSQTTK